ncbi:hypothetical protein GQ457_18G024920 [Hibiscus cannabinus]
MFVQSLLPLGGLKIGNVWTAIRIVNEEVMWHKIVWFSMRVSKHSLLAWMSILNRLPTSDRMQRMGIRIANCCLLCGSDQETRNHLFVECSYSKQV